jgi:hypothetical protein
MIQVHGAVDPLVHKPRGPFPHNCQLENIFNIPENLAVLQRSPWISWKSTRNPFFFADFANRPLVFKFFL